MYYIDGMTEEDVAQCLNVTQATIKDSVRTILSKIKRNFRKNF
jgi:DNA-binding NarL/FixJ family response regulator